ncbi:MAG: LON peptidase substrate-binding domain-containing protein [Acidimicrobiia bacterium]|nr:LON peptidase substrate-binding domain-containing protein [Acidimicrobiia bacterium]
MTERLAMFPLGSVLVPHMLLPLRVFEPRYLQMIHHLQAEGGEFGVVLIERGFEVGGGDARFDVGTIARIIEISELEGGHLLVLAAGVRRARVREWLDDDPYPQALVERLDDDPPNGSMGEEIAQLERSLRRSFGLMSELGYDVGTFETEIADDPVIAGYQGITLAPLSMMDRQDLLETDDAEQRLRNVLEMIDVQIDVFQQQLAGG